MVVDELLGPFPTDGASLLTVSPGDGSFTDSGDRFRMLRDTMCAAGVDLSGWDWIVLRWLSDQDVQAVAAVARWVGRARLAGLAAGAGCVSCVTPSHNHNGPPPCSRTAAGLGTTPASTREEPSK
jgi:hypothetical protein